MTDKRELLKRVQAATENDPSLFRAAYMALLPEPEPFTQAAADAAVIEAFIVAGAFTDAALALLERVLPGAFWHMAKGKLRAVEPLYAFQLLFGADEVIGEAEHNDLCLAIIAATLRAMHQEIGPRND